MAVIVSDTFSGANGAVLGTTDTGQTWSAALGSFVYSSGRAKGNTSGVDNVVLVDSGSSDGIVRAKFYNVDSNGRLYFRGINANSCFYINNFFGLTLNRRNGASTSIGSSSVSLANGDEVSVEMEGSTITVYLNGVSVITATDAFNETATSHGIGSFQTSAEFDDCVVESLATGGTTVTGSATLTGVGTVTASGETAISGSATLQAVGTLTASGSSTSPTPTGTATLTGVGTLSVSGAMSIQGTATLQGVATLTASGGSLVSGSATLTGVATLTATGTDGAPITSVVRLRGEIVLISLAGEMDSVSLQGSMNPSSVALEGET